MWMFQPGEQQVFREDQDSLVLRCLNWLVGQHLSSQRCWLTTSLMARYVGACLKIQKKTDLYSCSEAAFPEFGPPRGAVEGMVGERGKQYCTETLSKYTIDLENLPPYSYHL